MKRVYVLGQERLPRQLGSWDLRGVYHDLADAMKAAIPPDWFIIACPADRTLDLPGTGDCECGRQWFPAREPVPEDFL